MVISCHTNLDLFQDNQEKTDVYLTPNMELIWEKETSVTIDQMFEEYGDDDLLLATVLLCMKTYWTQIHRVNLNDFYYRKLQRMRFKKERPSFDEKNNNLEVFQFCLKVIDILKSQANRRHLPEFYLVAYVRYRDDYKYYDEAMDILMEWLDYKDIDFDWNSKMLYCLSGKCDYKEVEPYLIDCLEMVASYPDLDYVELYSLFLDTTKLIFYQKSHAYPVNPLFDAFFHSFIELPDSKRMEVHFTLDAKVVYDYANGSFLQKIGRYERETLMVKFVKLASLSSQRKEIIIDIVSFFIGNKTCFFKGIWRNLIRSEISIRSLQDEVLKSLIENYECLNERQEDVRLFANSCFLTRCLKNKAIS